MPAVVRDEPVAVFAEARARALDPGRARKRVGRQVLYEDLSAPGEGLERDLLDGAAPEQGLEAPVVDDAPVTGVAAVVPVEAARCDEMRAEGQVAGQWLVHGDKLDRAALPSDFGDGFLYFG